MFPYLLCLPASFMLGFLFSSLASGSITLLSPKRLEFHTMVLLFVILAFELVCMNLTGFITNSNTLTFSYLTCYGFTFGSFISVFDSMMVDNNMSGSKNRHIGVGTPNSSRTSKNPHCL